MEYRGFFDGSSKGNPGLAHCSWVILDSDNVEYSHKRIKAKEDRTNNYAEYMGLISLLYYLVSEKEIVYIEIFGDTALVINQVNGKWKCKSPNLKPLWEKAVSLFEYLTTFKHIKLTWIPREQNTIADQLAQEGKL